MIKTVRILCVIIPVITGTIVFAETKKPVEGFGGLKWGITMDEVRKGLKGKVVFDDEKRIIVTREGEITYRYGFFYKIKEKKEGTDPIKDKPVQPETPAADPAKTDETKPDAVKPATAAEPQPEKAAEPQPPALDAEDQEPEGESKFFYVVSEFPYIPLNDIRKKMTTQYGDSTGDTVSREQGALLWDTGNGVAIIWVDSYEKKPYCRKITYISKAIAKELNSYQKTIFNKKEIEVIKKLIP